MKHLKPYFKQYIVATALVLVLSTNLFGLQMHLAHHMGWCPFMQDMAVMCDMTAVDVISDWQTMLTATIITLPSMLLTFWILAIFYKQTFSLTQQAKAPPWLRLFIFQMRWRYRITQQYVIALANGLINPKLYFL